MGRALGDRLDVGVWPGGCGVAVGVDVAVGVGVVTGVGVGGTVVFVATPG